MSRDKSQKIINQNILKTKQKQTAFKVPILNKIQNAFRDLNETNQPNLTKFLDQSDFKANE